MISPMSACFTRRELSRSRMGIIVSPTQGCCSLPPIHSESFLSHISDCCDSVFLLPVFKNEGCQRLNNNSKVRSLSRFEQREHFSGNLHFSNDTRNERMVADSSKSQNFHRMRLTKPLSMLSLTVTTVLAFPSSANLTRMRLSSRIRDAFFNEAQTSPTSSPLSIRCWILCRRTRSSSNG